MAGVGAARAPAHPAGREGRRLIHVLDTAGVEAVAPLDHQRRARFRELRSAAVRLVVPAAVLAEGVLSGRAGHDFQVRRLLDVADIRAVDKTVGFAAGALRQAALRGGAEPPPSAVDAIVAATADALATHDEVQIVTSDPDDLELLALLGMHARRVSVLAV